MSKETKEETSLGKSGELTDDESSSATLQKNECIVISKRTTSLIPKKTSVPSFGLSSFTGLLSTLIGVSSEDEEEESKDMNLFIQQQQERLDSIDHQSIPVLELLKQQNHLLALNPKTILTEGGSFIATSSNFASLNQTDNDDDCEFWNSIMNDENGFNKHPSLIKTKVRHRIPSSLRPSIWMGLSDSSSSRNRMELLYPNLLVSESAFERHIKRDLARTFPKIEEFMGEDSVGQKKLYNLLKAYSVFDSEVGYCQGLSFVVGPIITQDISEVDAFTILVRLLEQPKESIPSKKLYYGLRSLYLPTMNGLHLMLYQHSKLLSLHLPLLSQHFLSLGVTPTMYASAWFLTIFAYNFPFQIVLRIFDIIFAEGATTTILKFGLALLKRSQEKLLKEDELEGVLGYLKSDLLVDGGDFEVLVKDAMGFSEVVTCEILDLLAKEYEDETTQTAEVTTMRSQISQLRVDARLMINSLRELNDKNERLEKVNKELRIFKKGAELEILELRRELSGLKEKIREDEIKKDEKKDGD